MDSSTLSISTPVIFMDSVPVLTEAFPIRHPLDPLTPDEIHRAVAVVRSHPALGLAHRFCTVRLHEPHKSEVMAFSEGHPMSRAAFVIVLDRETAITYEALVSLTDDTLLDWRSVPHVQPAVTSDEIEECEVMVKADPAFQAALARRGITQLERVMVDPWAVGHYDIPAEEGVRLARAFCWLRSGPNSNGYAKPIDGLTPVVDLNPMKVLYIEDLGGVPVPPEPGEYAPELVGTVRQDLKPLHIHQPKGPSFTVDGNQVRWQKWAFRVGFTPREGLVLHTVTYEDQGRQRPVLYRASVSEMVVPYGDPRPQHFRKNAFDVGEYGLGFLANSLKLGCDCLGDIYYFDAVVPNSYGEAVLIENAICLHEEDDGILWKHYDWRLDQAEVRRSRKLVISFISTIENYEYGFYWYFYQDGSIKFEVKLTGILLCAALAGTPKYGTQVAPELNALYHQHFFNMRLDVSIDGDRNSVVEVNTEAESEGDHNPWGNAFYTSETLFKTEAEAQRLINPLTGRYWKIINPEVNNCLGQPVAYRLVPGENTLPFARANSSIAKRAGFTTRHLWVTPYRSEERFAAGDYPNQNPGGDGLPRWTQGDRPIANTDIVVWYTFCHHHIPRPEEWPVMPVARIDFALKPDGFFERNPALDVPLSTASSEGHHPHCSSS